MTGVVEVRRKPGTHLWVVHQLPPERFIVGEYDNHADAITAAKAVARYAGVPLRVLDEQNHPIQTGAGT